MWDRLLGVVEEQAQALIRAAFSPIVRECGDISAGIFDSQGNMLAQAVTGTPGHINTMAEAVKTLLGCFPAQQMKAGDIYMTNDPWIASGHLNDFLLLQPAILNGKVVGYTSCTSHLFDLGGKGMGPDGSDIYDEGLFIPPCRLVENGQVNSLLLDIVKANSREPVANLGDIYALIACCETGISQLLAMMDEFKLAHLGELSSHIIETSAAATLDSIRDLAPGTYSYILPVDGYEEEIELHASLEITSEEIQVDFAGTSGCSKYGINVPLNYAAAYTVFAMRCVIGPDIPNNAGSLGLFKVRAPVNCILNAQHPAPVAMRHTLGQMTPDLVFGCLHQVIPERVPAEGASCMYDLPLRHTPESLLRGGKAFGIELTHNGGTGARPGLDGLSATAFPSGVWGSQVEISESVAPILIKRRELITDSGGAGEFQGGMGQRIEITPAGDDAFLLFLSVERMKFPARGRCGGHDGAAGRITCDGKVIPGKGEFRVNPGETMIVKTPGGGGLGNPAARNKDNIESDLQNNKISREYAKSIYKYHG
jgi:N-methylhydantoinase B